MEVEFEQVGGVIGRTAGGSGLGVGETQGDEVQALDVGVHEAGGGVGGDVILLCHIFADTVRPVAGGGGRRSRWRR